MILCCGEALIDMIPRAVEGGGEGFVPHSGGAIFNTAIALGRLGTDTGFLSGISTDLFGSQLVADLRRSNVDTDLSVRSDLPTTLAFVRLTDGHASYTFYDENTAGRSLTPDQVPNVPPSVNALYFGGISLISEPGADFYAALATEAAASHVVMLDPNIRTGFIDDETRYRNRLDRMISVADILKVSDEDLHWMIVGDAHISEKAHALLQQGPRLVIVTRGGDGACAYLKSGESVEVSSNKVTVVDTVGAGDTFNAGLLSSLDEQGLLSKEATKSISAEALRVALEHGAAVAAITVSRAGANPPWAEEISVDA